MTGLPTVTVKLDDGTGTFPYDISSFVRLPEGISWTRGRSDEFSDVQPGTLSLTLDNTDGRFTFGSVTYNVAPDQKIQLTVAGTNRFTGYVQSWPVAWPDGSDQSSFVAIEATDALARLARWMLDSATAEEVKADATLYYRLNEPQGATMASDSMGKGTQLSIASNGGTNPAFGTTLNMVDGSTGALFAAATTHNYLYGTPTGLFSTGSGGIHVEGVYSFTGTNQGIEIARIHADDSFNDGDFVLFVDHTGIFCATGGRAGVTETVTGVGGSGTNDGKVHILAVDITATGMSMYLDKTLMYSDSTARSITWDCSQKFWIGNGAVSGGGSDPATLAHVNIGVALSSARTLSHQKAATSDFEYLPSLLVAESADQRLARLAGYASQATGTLDTSESSSSFPMGPANQQGRSVSDCVIETSNATRGVAYIDANGALSSVNGNTIAGDTTPDATIDADYVAVDTAVDVDMQQVINFSVGNSTQTQNPDTFKDAASITTHGKYETDFSWNVGTDTQANGLTSWMVGTYAQPHPRVPTLTLDLLSMSSTTAALTLDVAKYLRVTGMPSQTPGGTQLDLAVDGITETISTTEWSLTLLCTQKAQVTGWILGDATYSVLGSTTIPFPG